MFITDPFVTDHVDNRPLLNIYCSVDAGLDLDFVFTNKTLLFVWLTYI